LEGDQNEESPNPLQRMVDGVLARKIKTVSPDVAIRKEPSKTGVN
jgi:hypothetical protein